jgi:hypothetical protein
MRSGQGLVTNLEEHMIRKMLLGAACAALVIGPAHAGFSLNGFSLNGFSLNGFSLNGFSLNGRSLQGVSLQAPRFLGVRPNPHGVDVGGHNGVGLNGQVIAIEF